MNMLEHATEEKKGRLRLPFPIPPKSVVVSICVVLGVLVITFGAAAAVQLTAKDRALSGITYAGIDVGGLDRIAVTEHIQSAVNAMLDAGLVVRVGDDEKTFALRSESVDVAYALIDIDVSAGVDAVMAEGKGKEPFTLLYGLYLATFGSRNLTPSTTIGTEQLTDMIRTLFADAEDPGVPTDFRITKEDGAYDIQVIEGEDGTALATEEAMAELLADAEDLSLTTLDVATVTVPPRVTGGEAETLIYDVEQALRYAPYDVTYQADDEAEWLSWEVTADDLTDWLMPDVGDDGEVFLTLDANAMAEFLATLHEAIDIAAQDARFAMENNRVVEFAGSHNGVSVNDAATIDAIVDHFDVPEALRGSSIVVAVDTVAPTVTTANVNSLGITEVLGVGASSYKGSPSNRIQNIAHGASKLNGILVAPGETVSLVEKLGPFTVADGYLPELVIKGDEIKPEVGGGLCQIGTTTFRAVMNSGLKVVERRNHSLVVSYYNDLSNGNPGTDATIYDPSPDFKFMNDTTNYILLTTEMNTEEQMLYFTFWGTSDGRKGSYEPPQVLSWSGYGATQYTETDTLAPGVEKCQSPHPGATTTFTYTIQYQDGTTYEEEFFSSYRSLPKICLVGRDPAAPPETPPTTPESSTETEPTSSDTITPVAE